MIRQAHTYLAGAVSGTVLIAIAVAIFVMLVSVQAAKDWPFAGLVGGDDAATSVDSAVPLLGGSAAAAGDAAQSGSAGTGRSQPGEGSGNGGGAEQVGGERGVDVTGTAPIAANGADPGTPATGGGGGGNSPAASSPLQSSAGGKSGGGGNGGSGGGGGNGGGEGVLPTSGGKVSETVTKTTGEVVSGVDQVTGGAAGQAGVGQVVEDTVKGVAGPESPVGGALDKSVKGVEDTVGGLLGQGD